jgi:hypothetical protein
MFASHPSPPPESEVSRSVPGEVAPSLRWRVTVLRSIAAAHVLAGILELLKVAGNIALKLPYTGGPLAVPGVVSVIVARVVYAVSQGVSRDPQVFDLRTHWIGDQAQSTGSFLGAMMAAHIALGALNAAVGYGLWRGLNWARWLDVAALGVSGLLVVAHGAGLLWFSGNLPSSELVAVALPPLVAAAIVAFLLSPRTGALFVNRDDDLTAPRKRRWWTLSLQCVLSVLVLAMSLILLALFALGLMAEVVWLAAELTVDRP